MRRLALLVFLILVATTYLVGCGDVTYAQPTETETPDSVAATEEEKEPTEFALHDLEQHGCHQHLRVGAQPEDGLVAQRHARVVLTPGHREQQLAVALGPGGERRPPLDGRAAGLVGADLHRRGSAGIEPARAADLAPARLTAQRETDLRSASLGVSRTEGRSLGVIRRWRAPRQG